MGVEVPSLEFRDWAPWHDLGGRPDGRPEQGRGVNGLRIQSLPLAAGGVAIRYCCLILSGIGSRHADMEGSSYKNKRGAACPARWARGNQLSGFFKTVDCPDI